MAHAVAASDAVGSEAADVAIIVKMTRVLMLVPALLIIGYWVRKQGSPEDGAAAITTPWFALVFLGVAGFNTLDLLPCCVGGSARRLGQVDPDHGDDRFRDGHCFQ